jgi:hypothetical protein
VGADPLQPIAVDLFAGLGGWTEGLLAEGYYVVGFDIERHEYGEEKYPAQLVLQDVLTIHGRQFKNAALIVASPPCQEFSYMAMPWSVAKQKAREYRDGTRDVKLLTALFDACFRIQREACEARGGHIPMVVENVRGAQPWVGRSRWSYGSFHLWGDVPALMPMAGKAAKVGGLDWSKFGTPGYKAQGFNTTADQMVHGRKNSGGSWFGVAHNTTSGKGKNPDGRDGHVGQMRNDPRYAEGIKQGGDWFNKASGNSISRRCSSKSKARKRAAAIIAKIPLALSSHIARVYHPRQVAA